LTKFIFSTHNGSVPGPKWQGKSTFIVHVNQSSETKGPHVHLLIIFFVNIYGNPVNVVKNIDNYAVVLDDYIPSNILESTYSKLWEKEEKLDGILARTSPVAKEEQDSYNGGLFTEEVTFTKTCETFYQRGETHEFNPYIEFLMNSSIFNLDTPHNFYTTLRLHRIPVGGFMVPHSDPLCTHAVTTYLNEVEGGLFMVEHPVTFEHIAISPRKNRTVIMQSGVTHWITEVTKGERLSLQTFITVKPQNDELTTSKE